MALITASSRPVALETVADEEEPLNVDAGSLPESGATVERPHETTETIYAQQHPVYTRCAKRVDMPEFVKTIRKTCGNVHELGTIAAPCHNMLEEHAKDFGCCWETVMKAYKQLDPQAHHSWRMWQGTVSGKAGIVFDQETCGDAMGEHDYKELDSDVKELKDKVHDQSKELQVVEGILMMSMGYYFKGDAAKLAATHAPFSAGEAKQLAQVYDTLQKKQRSHADNVQRARGRRVAHVRHQEHTRMQAKHMQKATAVSSSSFLSGAVTKGGDKGATIMREAGVQI